MEECTETIFPFKIIKDTNLNYLVDPNFLFSCQVSTVSTPNCKYGSTFYKSSNGSIRDDCIECLPGFLTIPNLITNEIGFIKSYNPNLTLNE